MSGSIAEVRVKVGTESVQIWPAQGDADLAARVTALEETLANEFLIWKAPYLGFSTTGLAAMNEQPFYSEENSQQEA